SSVVIAGYDDAERFAILRQMGFTDLIDLAAPGADKQLERIAENGFDVIIEAAGANSALAAALRLAKVQGRVVAVGIHARNIDVDVNLLVRKRLRLRGSYRANHAIWEKCIAVLAANPHSFTPMISHKMPLHQA